MNTSLFIARRYLVSKKTHNAINIITYISLLGICIGTAAMIIVLSALNGITALVFNLYNVFDPQLKIAPAQGKTFVPTEQMIHDLRSVNGVKAVSFVVEEKALVKSGDKQTIVTLKGVDDTFHLLNRFDTAIVAGNYSLYSDSVPMLVLGSGIAYKLDVNVESQFMPEPIHIYIPKREKTASLSPEDAFNSGIAYASGVFNLNDDFDFKYAIAPIHFVKKLLGYEHEVSFIELSINQDTDIDETAHSIRSILGNDYVVKTRFEQNEVLFKTLKSEKWWTFFILTFIIVIATFNIVGSVTMLIIEKKNDIKTLSALGADTSMIKKIFLTEGFFIALIGSIAGLILGLATCWIQIQYKPVPFSEGFIVDAYPVKIISSDVLIVFITVMLIGFAAAYYPVKVYTGKYHITHR